MTPKEKEALDALMGAVVKTLEYFEKDLGSEFPFDDWEVTGRLIDALEQGREASPK